MPNYHVVRDQNGHSWDVKREGAERISDKAGTQGEAESRAKEICGNAGGGEVRIHGLDGKIRDSDTVAPGNDSFPPRDGRH
jgi:hypothetical protein